MVSIAVYEKHSVPLVVYTIPWREVVIEKRAFLGATIPDARAFPERFQSSNSDQPWLTALDGGMRIDTEGRGPAARVQPHRPLPRA
jgi:hypothetical protein